MKLGNKFLIVCLLIILSLFIFGCINHIYLQLTWEINNHLSGFQAWESKLYEYYQIKLFQTTSKQIIRFEWMPQQTFVIEKSTSILSQNDSTIDPTNTPISDPILFPNYSLTNNWKTVHLKDYIQPELSFISNKKTLISHISYHIVFYSSNDLNPLYPQQQNLSQTIYSYFQDQLLSISQYRNVSLSQTFLYSNQIETNEELFKKALLILDTMRWKSRNEPFYYHQQVLFINLQTLHHNSQSVLQQLSQEITFLHLSSLEKDWNHALNTWILSSLPSRSLGVFDLPLENIPNNYLKSYYELDQAYTLLITLSNLISQLTNLQQKITIYDIYIWIRMNPDSLLNSFHLLDQKVSVNSLALNYDLIPTLTFLTCSLQQFNQQFLLEKIVSLPYHQSFVIYGPFWLPLLIPFYRIFLT